MDPSIARRAKRKALQSRCKFKISALGFNQNGICVMTRTNKYRFNREGGGLHAEEQILRVAARKGIVKILICRVGKAGDVLPIEPCRRCRSIADKLGIRIESIRKE